MPHVSLFIGKLRALPESGRLTGMYKSPAKAPIYLDSEGFAGDQQADRRVHGGPDKAVHLYPARHYRRLAATFPDAAPELRIGSLGENLSTDELDEEDVHIGDIWQLGGARLQVCQPRNPCWKIDERFGVDGMAAYIAEHRLTGWYWRVVTPGLVAPGDPLRLMEAADHSPTLGNAMRCWQAHRPSPDDLLDIANTKGIANTWKQKILARVEWLRNNPDSTT